LANQAGQTRICAVTGMEQLSHMGPTLEALLSAAVDAIITIDPRGKITSFNPAAERIFGCEGAAVLGQNVKCLMPEEYATHHDQYLSSYAANRQANIIGKGRTVAGLRADGSIFPMELSVGEILLEQGTGGYIGIVRDISARVQAEADARENREQLAHVTRLNSMGEMAAGIAHEVNQPLTAVASYAQACQHLLSQPEPNLGKVAQVLVKIDEQALRASQVIERLRSFVKKRSGDFVSICVSDLIQDTLALAKTDTRLLDYPVTVDVEADLPDVLADIVQVQQVLLNLVRNGVDAMSEGEASAYQEQAHKKGLEIQARRLDDKHVEVVVRDAGPGLAEAALDKLFHPFYTTKAAGMGIGLCVSRSIIRAHGGDLWYSPIEGRAGAAFHFSLALYD
jgi:two-component system sensor kinase FixL